MTIQLRRPVSVPTMDEPVVRYFWSKPQRTQPPRQCDRCRRPQSVYRHRTETLCTACRHRSEA